MSKNDKSKWLRFLSLSCEVINGPSKSGYPSKSRNYKTIHALRAAQLSCLEDFIRSLPEKYDSQLGVWFEGGVQLSGGQWQKLAIARAFIRNAEIYVLDEPTSSIDGFSQEEIFNNFREICSKKIGLFISHRLSNVIHADKIVVLKDGRINDIGTHEHLLERCDLYKRLYYAQANRYVKENDAEVSVTS